MKKIKLFSIQSVVLLCLFSFLFYQWGLLSGVEKEKQTLEIELKEAEATKKELEETKKEQQSLKNENEQLKKELSNILSERGGQKIAYLTFDDGPSKTTEKVLKTLKKYNVPATFFVNGSDSDFAKKMYQEMVKGGHSIGNHTYSHDYPYIYKNEKNFIADMKKLDELLLDITGEKPTLMRFPGGSNNKISVEYGGGKLMKNLVKKVEDNGYVHVDWNVDSRDTSAVKVDKNIIVEAVLKGSEGKQQVNILMHDAGAKDSTAKALPQIIEGLKKQGFEFRAMSDYSPLFQF